MKQISNKILKKFPEFDNHQSVYYLEDKPTGLKGYVSFHRNSSRIPSFGATRYWEYKSKNEALKDALRLSRLMSYKSAMAGIKYGGAKATIMRNDKFNKEKVLRSYTNQLNQLNGRFITGTDVGLSLNDLKKMKKESDFLVGMRSNPEKYTAVGLYVSILAVCKKVFGSESIKNRTFSLQGVGKVGHEFLKIIYKKAGKIYISDIDSKRLNQIHKLFPKTTIVRPEDIHKQKVDIFMPCALSRILNKKTINEFNCKIIIGSANNQLENITIADKLYSKGIFYGPDYVVNAGGLISVVDEYEFHNFSAKRIMNKVLKIRNNIETIIKKSDKERKSPARIANEITKKLISKKR